MGRVPSLRDPINKRRERERTTIDTSHALAQAIMRGGKEHSPADSLVISPAFELMGRQPVNEFPGANKAQHYLTFLKESLEGKLPGFGEETSGPQSTGRETLPNSDAASIDGLNVVLTREKPEQEILNIFRTPKYGFQDYTVVEIDTTAFESGGTLSIDISVGNAEPMGSFDLYDGKTEFPTEGMPKGALASASDIRPGRNGKIEYHFDQGQAFKLGATGSWFSEEGSINAFFLKISIAPEQRLEPRKVSSARPEQSAEDVMNAFVKAFKNLDAETILLMLTGDASETFESGFEDVPEDMRTQMSQILSQVKVLSSQYVGDEFHFRLRVPGSHPPELSVKMRKVEGVWLIYNVE